ncbi:tRNA (adenosine(37)-N6)-threonylcarbamoyltransferase complex dimerization subunit type 1 TsaB [Geminocystis sp. GBBB08]|uniref:tRNA (adenosine(37)-N6)-threonylcarbamoyltransferase complex dimerization subunit type 1 TsaB n=1 Tax=Geminocystis sp. GBBB08 TaxID=2604140 RepID=UPI0027E27724|nr:tRNA (adenosine(37)-N6)-threonylcarbamoyltransferase complex dimerization subunit type 1 TsaB [Geminocystis sp. GBBB08]MBL1211357.1 tRNA (adenosine(37)-N6)-threonylcarbamoyltransferase complex dimerization subunit type 1 TsaB [Geminocystis sp. GBBB08]
MKQGLALHTTSPELGVAIINNQGKYRFNSWNLGKNLANNLHEKIVEFLPPLSWQDLTFIAVAKGPGSFTSTRIGVVTAKTLAQQLKIPVFGISTLESLAWYYGKKELNNPLLVVEMKANNEEVFGSIYQFSSSMTELSIIIPDTLFKLEEWQDLVTQYQEKCNDNLKLIISSNKLAFTTETLLEIALFKSKNTTDLTINNWQNLTPFYN